MLKTAEVLMTSQMMPVIIEGLDRAVTLHRAWETPDPERFIDEIGPRVRGLAAGAHSTVDEGLMARLPRLEIIANFGVGYDSVDARAAARRGIVVTNTPDVLTEDVADLAVALLLATVRRLPQAERYLRAGKWLERPFPLTATLRGRKVGILGLGRIGRAIAERLAGFGVELAYHSRRPQPEAPFAYHPTPAALASAVDALIVVTPGGAETRHMVNAEVLRALGPDGVLVNVARGTVVDERALIEALRTNTILAAGLDVFENEPHVPQELIEMDNAVLLPHVASASVHTRNAMGQLVVDNLVSWFSGKGPLTPVPETPWPAPKA